MDINMTDENIISLRDYIDFKIAELEKAFILARQVLEQRLNTMNEIREQLRTQKSEFVTRLETDQIFRDIRELRESRAELQGKASQSSVFLAYLMSGISILISIIGFILHRG
jgi:uncharacterized coiled-coil DUF342 family protein